MTKSRYIRTLTLTKEENDKVNRLQEQCVSVISIFRNGLKFFKKTKKR